MSQVFQQEIHDPEMLDGHAEAGHEFIRIVGKAALDGDWPNIKPMTLAEAKARLSSKQNVGIRLRPTDLVIDVDVRPSKNGIASFEALKIDFALPPMPMVKTGGGGFHCYLTKSAGIAITKNLDRYPGIDFLSVGQQVVAAGSIHSTSKKLYVGPDFPLDMRLSDAPEAPQRLLMALCRPTDKPLNTEPGEVTPELLEWALGWLEPEDFREYEAWFNLMAACHHATAGHGRTEFITWSISDPPYADHGTRICDHWDSLKMRGAGARTVRSLVMTLPKEHQGEFMERTNKTDPEDDFQDEPEVAKSSADRTLEEINRTHFTVLHAGKYLVGRERNHPTLGTMEVEWFPDYAVKTHLDAKFVTLDDGSVKPLGSWWVKHPRRRIYDGVVFDPSPNREHPTLYNLWRGWSVEPKPGDWTPMKRLIKEVLCGGDEAAYDYVIRWTAFMVQKPSVPAEVALVFKGPKGIGKGTFARALKDLAGKHGKQVAQAEHFVGRFNEHLQDCILLFVDEGYWAGDKKAEGALKNLITEPTLTFEPKGRPIVSGPNMLHVVIVSNEEWIVPTTADERRFAVFEASTKAHGDLPEGFFKKLNQGMSEAGLSAMLHELLAIELGDWHPRGSIPKTQALVDQKVQAFRRVPLAHWWFRALESGYPPWPFTTEEWREGHLDVVGDHKETVVSCITEGIKGSRGQAPLTKTAVARFLKSVGADVEVRDTKGNRAWRIPTLKDARSAFERHTGGSLEWDS